MCTNQGRLIELSHWAGRGQHSEGWDFAHLGLRVVDPLPWDYAVLARAAASYANTIVDLGTGGGERLSEIVDGIPARVIATEQWSVNARIAADRLAPAGVGLVRCASDHALPFRDGTFDLVLDRHEALDPAEVTRILLPGGDVLTQQVGHDNWPELRAAFPRATTFPDHRTTYPAYLRGEGFATKLRRHSGRVVYPTLGQYVYQVAACPWVLPDFDIEADIEAWLALERRCATPDGLVVTETRYLLAARKPVGSS